MTDFPPKNTVVENDALIAICEEHNLKRIITIIENAPPKKAFMSDGASSFPDVFMGVDLYPAAFLHDIKYWCGFKGDTTGRYIADLEFAIDICTLCGGQPLLAQLLFEGVRFGGTEFLPTSWRWGYGR